MDSASSRSALRTSPHPPHLLLDTSDAWEPDGDGALAAVCPRCESAHWTIPFVTFVVEHDFDFEDGIMIGPERFLAETIANLRAKASRPAVERIEWAGEGSVAMRQISRRLRVGMEQELLDYVKQCARSDNRADSMVRCIVRWFLPIYMAMRAEIQWPSKALARFREYSTVGRELIEVLMAARIENETRVSALGATRLRLVLR